MSTIRAGLLTFLAALHGGVTIDATPAQFLPLGMLLIVGLVAWRAGSGLADAADRLGEHDPVRLAVAGGAQVASFAVACVVIVPFAELGTSDAPFVGVAVAATCLFSASGGVAFLRSSSLGEWCAQRIPYSGFRVARAGAAAVAVYLASGAALVAGSLIVHNDRVTELSRGLGSGWSAVPVLLLGVLAAPNAVIAGSSYLAGPGFSVGTGTSVNAFTTAHGVLPDFPLLGGLPEGHGATPLVWGVMAVTPVVAAIALARLVAATPGFLARLRDAAVAAVLAGSVMLLLAWQGGGGIGTGRLATVGASPWRVGVAVFLAVLVVASLGLAVVAAAGSVRRSRRYPAPLRLTAVTSGDDPDRARSLAG